MIDIMTEKITGIVVVIRIAEAAIKVEVPIKITEATEAGEEMVGVGPGEAVEEVVAMTTNHLIVTKKVAIIIEEKRDSE